MTRVALTDFPKWKGTYTSCTEHILFKYYFLIGRKCESEMKQKISQIMQIKRIQLFHFNCYTIPTSHQTCHGDVRAQLIKPCP